MLTSIIACDNELDVVEEFRDIPVVYAYLSMTDTAQYFRIERGFIDENTSALILAQNPDSLYYSNATVTLEHSLTGNQFEMERVDGNLEGFVRDEGAFAQSPNYLYKLRTSELNLLAENEYNLIINRGDGTDIIESSTVLIGPSDLKVPNVNAGSPISFNSIDFTNFIWTGSPAAKIYNLSFEFNYRERDPLVGSSFDRRSVTWRALRNFKTEEDDGRVAVEILGANFFSFIGGAIPIDENMERRFDDLTVIISGGGQEIREFVQIGSANLGITSTQDPPFFSNIEGGRGVFSSTYDLVINNVAVSNQTLDSLRDGQFTRNLGFQ